MGYLLLIGPYVVVNIEKFGSFYPPATRSFPFATSAGAIYGLRNPTLSDMLGLGVRGNIDLRLAALAARSAEFVGRNGGFVMVAILLLTGVALGATSLPSWRELWRSPWLLPCAFGAGFVALHVVATPAISASGAFVKSSPLLVSLLLPVALIGLDRLTSRTSWRAVLIAVLLVPLAFDLASATRQVLAEDTLVGAQQRALLPRLNGDRDCVTGDIVVMTRTPWQFTLATGIPSVQIPDASRADILREAERWGVTHVAGNRFMKELRGLFASGGEDAVLEGLSSNLWRLRSPRTDHCIAPSRP